MKEMPLRFFNDDGTPNQETIETIKELAQSLCSGDRKCPDCSPQCGVYNYAKEMRELREIGCDNAPFEFCNKYDRCEDCPIDRMATALYNAGYRKQEWISVDDRLPDTDEVLVYCRKGVGHAAPKKQGLDKMDWDVFFNITGTTHWMPLPMPPKGVEGEPNG